MNKKLLIAFLALIPSLAFAQQGTYEITETALVNNVADYERALDNSNFDVYRFQTKRRTLKFRKGLVVELLSVAEVKALGLAIDGSKSLPDDVTLKYDPTFVLNSKGQIIAESYSATKRSN